MAAMSQDINCCNIAFITKAPIKRTTKKILIQECTHSFQISEVKQDRRADECPTTFEKCIICNLERKKE